MKILSAVAGLVVGLAVPGLAAEDFTSTKEVRLIHGDLGSPKAKTVVMTDIEGDGQERVNPPPSPDIMAP